MSQYRDITMTKCSWLTNMSCLILTCSVALQGRAEVWVCFFVTNVKQSQNIILNHSGHHQQSPWFSLTAGLYTSDLSHCRLWLAATAWRQVGFVQKLILVQPSHHRQLWHLCDTHSHNLNQLPLFKWFGGLENWVWIQLKDQTDCKQAKSFVKFTLINQKSVSTKWRTVCTPVLSLFNCNSVSFKRGENIKCLICDVLSKFKINSW